MRKYDFLYTCDQKYFPHTLTSIYSLILNHIQENIAIHIIYDGFEKEEYLQLERIQEKYNNVEICLYSLDKMSHFLEKYSVPNWRGSSIPNARLFAQEVLPDISKILYIDGDTIIQDSLTDLFKVEENAPVLGVKEMNVPLRLKELLSTYYNSGVLFFDYDIWNKEDCLRILCDTILDNKIPLYYPDQDILNISFSEMMRPLDVSYNIKPIIHDIMKYPLLAKYKFYHDDSFYSYEEIKEAIKHPHIVHLLGTIHGRPWEDKNTNPFNLLYDQYRNLWDNSYEKEENNRLLTKIKLISFLNVLCTTCIPTELSQQVKNKVKEKIDHH